MLPTMQCEQPLAPVVKNLGSLLLKNQVLCGERYACAERSSDGFRYWSWQTLMDEVLAFAGYLTRCDLGDAPDAGGRIAFLTNNSYPRLVCELAVMASGLTSVPIFAGYAPRLTAQLLDFSQIDLLVTDDPARLAQLPPRVVPDHVVVLGGQAATLEWLAEQGLARRYTRFQDALESGRGGQVAAAERFAAVSASTRALIMYTSGTSGFPKGVQLSHHNLLSQQQALQQVWKPEPGMRFLCYLPWHHSFGGLFERLFALGSRGCLAIDDSRGKNVDRLLENFAEIRPHIYFSVPKVYQEIIARVLTDAETCAAFFHPELKFVFTAAAPLPLATSDVFKAHGVPVVEGWGLTETAPCCTLTTQALERKPGVVGQPIPGVRIALAEDGEILVKGPNVTAGYFRNPEATAGVFDAEGWFKTGDIGTISDDGLRIVSRKERMFKLSNGEKVFPSQIEDQLSNHCKFVKHAYVFGDGRKHPCLLVFPNRQLINAAPDSGLVDHHCTCPASLDGLADCLGACIEEIQVKRGVCFEKVDAAVLMDRELSLENDELTPSFKMIPRRIEKHFADCIEAMKTRRYQQLPKGAYVVQLNAAGRHGK